MDNVIEASATEMIKEVIQRARQEDHVYGEWSMLNAEEGRLWCDTILSPSSPSTVDELGESKAEDET